MFLGVIRFISPENELPEPPSGPTEYFYTDIYDFSSRRTDESKDFENYEDLTTDLPTSYHSYDAVPQQDKGKNRFLRIWKLKKCKIGRQLERFPQTWTNITYIFKKEWYSKDTKFRFQLQILKKKKSVVDQNTEDDPGEQEPIPQFDQEDRVDQRANQEEETEDLGRSQRFNNKGTININLNR